MSGREVVQIDTCTLPLGRAEKRRRIDEAMAAVGRSPIGGRMYSRLSGGEKQKLAVARCLCKGPELLLDSILLLPAIIASFTARSTRALHRSSTSPGLRAR